MSIEDIIADRKKVKRLNHYRIMDRQVLIDLLMDADTEIARLEAIERRINLRIEEAQRIQERKDVSDFMIVGNAIMETELRVIRDGPKKSPLLPEN